MSEIRVTNVLGENGNSPVNFTKGINMSGIVTATSFVPTTGQLSHRNLIINGAMNVAQRGVTSTLDNYGTVDRFKQIYSGQDEVLTQEQVDVASGTTPYSLGFRKAFKITNGNQTSGAGASDIEILQYKIEAQDIASSGWNYTSSSSFITLSFWVKASVAQSYTMRIQSQDGTRQNFPFEIGPLTANTWTKVTKKIPGNSNLQFDNDSGEGLLIEWLLFRGTNYTDNSISNDTWAAYVGSTRSRPVTSTWWTTNDATFEMTGVQLEVGPVATPFEHCSYGDQLRRCQRYFHIIKTGSGEDRYVGQLQVYASGNCHGKYFHFPVTMRTTPTTTLSGTIAPTNASGNFAGNFSSATFDRNTPEFVGSNNTSGSSGLSAGNTAAIGLRQNSSISSSAEL